MTNRNKAISVICFLFTACVLLFQTAHAEVPCVPAFIKEDERKLDPLKNTLFSGNKTFSETKGVESYNEALVRELKSLLGRKPDSMQIEAIEKANLAGKDKNEIARIREKTKILKEAGFSREEIRELMENDIVWIKKYDLAKLLIENLRKGNREGKSLYFVHEYQQSKSKQGERIATKIEIGRINTILKETNVAFLLEVDFLDPSSGALRRDIISISKGRNIAKIVPVKFEVLFEATQSEREIITLEDLNLPTPTNKEAELTKQGYGLDYTKGLDDLNEWAAVRRQLQELKANPYTTHVEYFANQIQDHIKHIEIAISSSANTMRLIYLKKLAEEARQAITDKKVTYKWWLEFNNELSYIVSNSFMMDPFYPSIKSYIESMIDKFPLKMMMPTTKGELGYMILSRASNEGIYPLGLINKTIEGRQPIDFIKHDMEHARTQMMEGLKNRRVGVEATGDILSSIGQHLLHKRILESLESLPFEKRKQAEWDYYRMIHEEDGYYDLFPQANRHLFRQIIYDIMN